MVMLWGLVVKFNIVVPAIIEGLIQASMLLRDSGYNDFAFNCSLTKYFVYNYYAQCNFNVKLNS